MDLSPLVVPIVLFDKVFLVKPKRSYKWAFKSKSNDSSASPIATF